MNLEWHPEYKHICYNPYATASWPHGWYWADETHGLNGCYNTAEEAKAALDSYVEEYLK